MSAVESGRLFSRRLDVTRHETPAGASAAEYVTYAYVAGAKGGRDWVLRVAQMPHDGREGEDQEVVLTAGQVAAVLRALCAEGVTVL